MSSGPTLTEATMASVPALAEKRAAGEGVTRERSISIETTPLPPTCRARSNIQPKSQV